MRTSMHIPDRLLAQAKLYALKRKTTVTQVVVETLREKFRGTDAHRGRAVKLKETLLAIGARCAALPPQDPRTAEAILGYDENGLPQ